MRGLPSKANKAGYVSVGVLFAALAFAGCTFYPPISGSGVLVEATADFEGFSRVSADSTFDVTVVADSSYGVTVTVDDNILEHVRMDRDGQELRIGLDPWYSYRNVTVKALVSMPVLSGVELAGASSLAVTGGGFPSAPAFEANVSGASTLSVPDIAAGSFRLVLSGASTASVGVTAGTVGLEVSGASRLTAGGSTGKMVAGVSGASEVDLRGLPGTDADLEISGASRMWVDLSGVVDADVSGGSTLHYRGGLTWGRLRVSGGSLLKPY
jgi:hypothetical protein